MSPTLRQTHPKTLRLVRPLAAAAVLTMLLTACDENDPAGVEQPTIAELTVTTPQLGTLAAALDAAGLAATLDGAGPFTVFAPVDAAFAELGEARIARLLEEDNEELLRKVLTYHVVPGVILAADLVDGASVTTVEGSRLTVDLDGGATVGGAPILATDIRAGNGVVHLVGGVLTGNLDLVDVAVLEGFDALVEAVGAAGLDEALRAAGGDGLTLFAPTDAAFAALGELPSDPDALGRVLLYHAVGGTVLSTDLTDGQVVTTLQGGTLTVDLDGGVALRGARNDAGVVGTDLVTSNGVIHAIDAVLLPPAEQAVGGR